MDQVDYILKSSLELIINNKSPYIRIGVCLLILSTVLKALIEPLKYSMTIISWLINMFKPMNYELDMTTKEYCKNLAEVDNNLKFQTSEQQRRHQTEQRGEHNNNNNNNELTAAAAVAATAVASAATIGSLDCATGLLSTNENNSGSSSSVQAKDLQASALSSSNHLDGQTTATSTVSDGKSCEIQAGSSEHVYPNGWLPVMESDRIKAGHLERAVIMGRDIIVTRSSEGEVSVLDAYCPHMGVHIGVGGRVLRVKSESCVQCPFHGWTFRASDGQCVSIPYLKSSSQHNQIPKQARLRAWQCVEVDNFIYVWHHIDDQPPSWFLEQTPELSSGSWTLAGRSCHMTNLDLRDMHENGADMNHFEGIHNDLFVFGGEFLKVQAFTYFQKYSRHHWAPDWKPILTSDGKMSHKAQMTLASWISFLRLRVFHIEVRAVQVGPACVSLRYNSQWYGRGILKMNSIPLGGRRTMYVQHIYTENSLFNWLMAKWVLWGEIMQLERDLFIWNHKKNISTPVFVPDDKIIKRFRMWYSQFYRRKRVVTIRNELVEHCNDNKVENNNNNNNSSSKCLDF